MSGNSIFRKYKALWAQLCLGFAIVTLEGLIFFGLIVILLLARRIKALLQKRSFLKVVRMMTQEQKQYLTNSGLMIEKRY